MGRAGRNFGEILIGSAVDFSTQAKKFMCATTQPGKLCAIVRIHSLFIGGWKGVPEVSVGLVKASRLLA